MSMSFGSSSTDQKQKGKQDPWAPAVPYIKDFLPQIPQPTGVTPDQQAAAGQIKEVAGQGNPYAGDIDALAKDLFATGSYAPQVGGAYDDLSRRLTPTADGTNLDIENNPYIQRILQQTADDAQTRINAQFAAAGRDMSGYNQQAVARGVTQAQLPVLADLFSKEQGRTDAAARDLFEAGKGTATTQAGLDQLADQLRTAGIDVGKSAIDAELWGPNSVLQIDEQLKQLPFDELAKIAELLYGAGNLGKQTESKGSSSTSSFGLGVKLI